MRTAVVAICARRIVGVAAFITCVVAPLGAQASSASRWAQRTAQRRQQAVARARRAVADEQLLLTRGGSPTLPRPNTVFVVPSPGGEVPAALARGLADLISGDLAKLRGLTVVERQWAQAALDEIGQSALDVATRPRSGRLIGASTAALVTASASNRTLDVRIEVVGLTRGDVRATLHASGTLDDLFGVQRRLSLDVARTLGVTPSAAERRAIVDRPSTRIDAFLAWSAALQAAESGELPRAEQQMSQALALDASINAAFDAGQLAIATTLQSVVPMPSGTGAPGESPADAALATEGNESEFGEAWFEGTGDRKLTLYEFAVPVSTSMSLARGRLDLATVWSSNRADTPANDVFHASGFTDVHLRYSHQLGASGVTASLGAALPTRDVHGVDDDIRRVPLPPDLLPSSMYRRRNAPSVSGGVYLTRSLASWVWGAAAGAEWTQSFNEHAPTLEMVSVAPGVRWRVRVDAEHALLGGRVAVGTALLALSPSTRAGGTVRGGERVLVRVSWDRAMGGADAQLGAWSLRSAPVVSGGRQLRAGSSVGALFGSVHSAVGGFGVESGLEWKFWHTQRLTAAQVWVPQVAVTRALGMVELELGVDFVRGHFHEPPATVDIPVEGWMLRMGVRIDP